MVDFFTNRNFPPFAFGPQIDERRAILDDYWQVGQLIVQWATNAIPRPADMQQFRQAVGNLMHIPAAYTRFRIEQADSNTAAGLEFVLRLPPDGQVAESENRIKQGAGYVLPPLYSLLAEARDPEPTLVQLIPDQDPDKALNLETFYARVADYTMRSCR